MSVYVLAMACVLNSGCTHGYFLVHNTAFVNCEQGVLPMVEGHRIKNRNGTVVTWHAEGCLESKNPPANRKMLGMF